MNKITTIGKNVGLSSKLIICNKSNNNICSPCFDDEINRKRKN